MKRERAILIGVAVFIFVIYAFIAIRIASRMFTPTGDEPHYLVTTHSLVVDGDISLLNNYREQQYRFIFYPGLLPKRTTGSGDGKRELPTFSPGMPLFLMLPYKLALTSFKPHLVPFLRVVVALVAVIGLYQLMALGARWTSTWTVVAVITGAAFASPLATYSNQIYPEIFAFTLLALALRKLQQLENRTWNPLLWLSLIPGFLAWLHPKYLFLSFLLILLAAYLLRQKDQAKWTKARVIHAVLSLACLFSFFLFLKLEYNSWSPNRMYGGYQKETSLIKLFLEEGWERILIMARMSVGFWIDERFGVVPWAPAYLAFFPALVWIWRNRRMELAPAMILFGVHFLALCWGAPLGGFAPPARHFVVMAPFLLLPVMFLYQTFEAKRLAGYTVLQITGFVILVLMFRNYRAMFANITWRNPDGISPFWEAMSIHRWIPNLIATQLEWFLVIAWIAVLGAVSFALYPTANTQRR